MDTATGVIEFLTYKLGINIWVQKLQSSWIGFFFTMGGITLWMILLLFYFSVFKFVWLIVCSPIFIVLSQRTESIISGEIFRFDFSRVMEDVKRACKLALRNFFRQIFYLLILLFVSFIPLIGWAMPLLALFFECL